jgi:uncharacterized protein involved in outer membrane biogenesis
MSRSLKRILIAIGGAAGMLLILAVAVPLLLDFDGWKPRLELAASAALGMDVRIGGRLGGGVFPDLHVTVEDGRILGDQGVAVVSARRARFRVGLLPLLRGEVRLRRVELTGLRLSVVRDTGGRFNVGRLRKAAALLGALDGAGVSLSDGTVSYTDRGSGTGFEATALDLKVDRIRFAAAGSAGSLGGLSLRAELACGAIRTKRLSISALKVSVVGKDGSFELDPVTMRIFGGTLTGRLRADVSGPVAACQLRCSLPRFRIEEFVETLSPKPSVAGAMDFSANLSMQGNAMKQMLRTAAGQVSLRGEDLTLVGDDLDRRLSRFESSQNFNLVDVGAVFFAGPLGLAVTKGFNFASLFRGSGDSSSIRALVSEWSVARGVARATDVALATSENRIALRGGLDLVNDRFVDMTVAVVDAKGCARVRQAIHGSFADPVVEKPRVLTSLAGPVLKLYQRTRGMFPAGPCELYYSGSVAPPR